MSVRIISNCAVRSISNSVLHGKLFETGSVCLPRFHKTGFVVPYSFYSSDEVKSVSKLLSETHKALFYVKPIETEEPPTTQDLLLDCHNLNDVLELFINMHQSKQLADDDHVLYLHKVFELLKQQCSLQGHSETHSPAQVLQDNRFQSLIEKTMMQVSFLGSESLSLIFLELVQMGIPVSSHTMQHIIKAIKSRINDFFLEDVAMCLRPLRQLGLEHPTTQELNHILLLHLENLAIDENFFYLPTTDPSLLPILEVCEHFGDKVSSHVRTCLQRSCKLVVTTFRKDQRELTVLEKIKLKSFLANFGPVSTELLGASYIDQEDIPTHKQELLLKLNAAIKRKIESSRKEDIDLS